MSLINTEFIESNENLSKDELKDLLGVNEGPLKYYKKIGLFKRRKTKREGKYIFSPTEINFLTFLKDLRKAGLPLCEVK